MATSKFAVIVGTQGSQPKPYMLSTGATAKTALKAAGHDVNNFNGSFLLNNAQGELNTRLKSGDVLIVSPKVAGGKN